MQHTLISYTPLGIFLLGQIIAAAIWAARVHMRLGVLEEAMKRHDELERRVNAVVNGRAERFMRGDDHV